MLVECPDENDEVHTRYVAQQVEAGYCLRTARLYPCMYAVQSCFAYAGLGLTSG